MSDLKEHYAGEQAYWDTITSGMVPCTVLEVFNRGVHATTTCHIKIDRTVRPWRVGETHKVRANRVVPRKSRKMRAGKYYVVNDYVWKEEPTCQSK